MNCATPLVLAALSGAGPVHHPGVVTPPFDRTATPPPASGKTVWGTELENHVSSDNFTVAWEPGDGTQAAAERVSLALEAAWSALVEAQGWEPPVSSDDYLLWVILDPSLGSYTGYTTELFDSEFPEGVPVIYMNPDYAAYGTFWEHLAIHEFNHMLQYRVREWSGDRDEAWYWEASAEWASELAAPELDVYALQTNGYSDAPELRYNTIDGTHEYGMLVLNAWLEEYVLGEGGLLAVWEEAEQQPGEDWLEILETVTGFSPGTLWAGFTAALAHGDLREGDLYGTPVDKGGVSEDTAGRLAELGTDYWLVDEDTLITVSGDAILGTAQDTGTSAVALAGESFTVTALVHNASYSLSLDVVINTGDTGDTGGPDDAIVGNTPHLPDEDGLACGCRSSPVNGRYWLILGCLAVLHRQRSEVAAPPKARV